MIFSFLKKGENRPWGNFEILNKSPNFLIKKITVNPQKRLSYQNHAKRAEHWYIIAGNGEITLDGQVLEIKTGQSIDIPAFAKHRIENTDKEDNLIFIEISTGYFDENDIVRFEDDFGRTGK